LVCKKTDGTNWHENVADKPAFILKCLELFPDEDIVWVDIDAKLCQYPVLFDEIEEDFAAYQFPINDKTRGQVRQLYGFVLDFLYFTGTMFFKNNDKARELLRRWLKCHFVHEKHKCPTQRSLYDALKYDCPKGLNIYNLPESYCYIMPKKGEPDPDRVIEHYIVSAREGLKEVKV
jgi:hypothetical protein